MNFPESQDYLYSLGNEVEAMKLGLENVRTLLTALGEPHKTYKKVQVAGTNGKGSVCVFLDSICREAGIRTGLYTSPHLTSITERIKVDSADISENDFARLATTVRELAEKMLYAGELSYRPTFFEHITAIALLAFAEANVELAILETGLGGRLDATTAAEAEIVAITRIDLDHQEYLGDTIEEIAAEKAAIIRPGTRVAIGAQNPIAMRVLLDRCIEVRVEPITTYDMLGARVSLAGHHQAENARTAAMLSQLVAETRLSDYAISRGLETTVHPGRLERIGNVLLDGAHNPGGIAALVNFLDEFYRGIHITLIFGAMRGKNVAEMAKTLWPCAARMILTQPSNSRAMTTDELRQHLPGSVESAKIHTTDSVDQALRAARELTPDNGIILVTGSLYLVGEFRSKLVGNI